MENHDITIRLATVPLVLPLCICYSTVQHKRTVQDCGAIRTRPCRVNRGGDKLQTPGGGGAIIIWFSHLNGTIANQIVTGVATHRGMMQPPVATVVDISSFTERLINATQIQGTEKDAD